MSERVTLEGTVTADSVPIYNLHVVAGEESPTHSRGGEITIALADGRRVAVNGAAEIRPDSRTVSGPWSEIRMHPTRPPGDFHPDGHVKLWGQWIVPGDRLCVIGEPTEHAFVDQTGGHRDAPEQVVIRVDALVIGVGPKAAKHARKALADVEKQRRPQAPSVVPLLTRVVAIVLMIATVVLIASEPVIHAGLLSVGLTCGFCALMFLWWSLPLAKFPGGASTDDEEDNAHPALLALIGVLLVLPLSAIPVAFLDNTHSDRLIAGGLGLVTAGWVPVWRVGFGLFQKPYATPGDQVLLPSNKTMRSLVSGGLIVIRIATVLLTIPRMSCDSSGPM